MQNDIVKPPKVSAKPAAIQNTVPTGVPSAVEDESAGNSGASPAAQADISQPSQGSIQLEQAPTENPTENAVGQPDQQSELAPKTEKPKVSKPKGPALIITAAFLLCVVFAGLAVYIQMK